MFNDIEDRRYFTTMPGTQAAEAMAKFKTYREEEFPKWLEGLGQRLGFPKKYKLTEYMCRGSRVAGVKVPPSWEKKDKWVTRVVLPSDWMEESWIGYARPKMIKKYKNEKGVFILNEKERPGPSVLAGFLFNGDTFTIKGLRGIYGVGWEEINGQDIIEMVDTQVSDMKKEKRWPKGLRPVKASTVLRWKGL